MKVVPYKEQSSGKKEQVAQMFDNISRKYDFLNHTLSLGIDNLWRRKAIKMLKSYEPKVILDVATGTGDFALAALKLNPEKVIGVDISAGMLEVGKEKMRKKQVSDIIEMQLGDSEGLNFEENKFDAVIVAFGVRNFENLEEGLKDMRRVLKEGGQLLILEFSTPTLFPFKQIYHFYFRWILPKIGRLISKDQSAYSYLPESVRAFPSGEGFLKVLDQTGYKVSICKPLTLGISSIYLATK